MRYLAFCFLAGLCMAFPLGRFDVKIEETTFSLADYNRFLETEQNSIASFKQKQQAAFDAEREHWRSTGQAEWVSEEAAASATADSELPAGCHYISAVVPGSVWKIEAQPGATVVEGESVAVLESMKMEIPLTATRAGVVVEWLVSEGTPVAAGQHIAVLREVA